ncbi:hypothetical protein D3C76_1403700 [compost metagenome]
MHGVAFFTGKVAAGLQANQRMLQIDQRHATTGVGNDRPLATACPRHIGSAAIEVSIIAQLKIAVMSGLDQRNRAFGDFQPCTGQQHRAEHGFAQGKRGFPVTDGAQYRAHFKPVGATAAGLFRHQGAG